MGNCQATDAAAVVIQHPDGSVERLYWPATAGEIMKSHPGHYVALVTFCVSSNGHKAANATVASAAACPSAAGETVRFTRVRLLKHKDMLLIGQVYRLVTSQEVAKALQARKQERMRKAQEEQIKQHRHQQQQQQQKQGVQSSTSAVEGAGQVAKHEQERQRSSRQWRPSLQSISEAGS